jgi:hypothetical protein
VRRRCRPPGSSGKHPLPKVWGSSPSSCTASPLGSRALGGT